jgi:REP element-mobilizing transposase RayT
MRLFMCDGSIVDLPAHFPRRAMLCGCEHVHMMISIPPIYAVSNVVGYIKGKSAIHTSLCVQRAQEELCRAKLLGTRVFCIDGWSG